MRDRGLGSWPARRRRMTPEHTAFVHGEVTRSYAALDDRTRALAESLRGLGVGRGDRVAYLGPNDPALLETLFATTALGAVFVPLNWRLAEPELVYIAGDCEPTVLVHAPSLAATARAMRGAVGSADGTPLQHLVEVGPELEALAATDGGATDGGATDGGHEPRDEPVGLDDPAVIIYTSGTTGRPKGATLSHGNITWNSVNLLLERDISSDDVALVCAPLFHVAALNVVSMPMVLKGGTIVIEDGFDPDRALDLIERHRVTEMFGVPAMFNAIAQSPRFAAADLSSVRRLLCGGAPVPLATIRTYLDRGLAFMQGYGMTETAPGALMLSADRAVDKAGTAGVPSFFTEVRVVTPDGRDVAPGEKGEVVVAGPNIMLGYWNRPDATAEVMDGEWFHSGDVAVVDEDGFVTIVDRMKDVIISGGENIYPAEVEDVLHGHPGIADCAVIGVPDERWGEVGRAVVVARPGHELDERAVLDHLDGKLARYKRPRSVVFVDQLPRSGAGKVLKKQLRAAYGEA
jgi:fatty-acyl-CoA synthase